MKFFKHNNDIFTRYKSILASFMWDSCGTVEVNELFDY
jgi:hypothetical protein